MSENQVDNTENTESSENTIKDLLINIAVFLILFACVETFFYFNATYHWVKPQAANYKPPASSHEVIEEFLGPGILGPVPDKYIQNYDMALDKYNMHDQDLMYKATPNFESLDIASTQEFHSIAKIKESGALIYDVVYKIASHKQRQVENQNQKKKANKFVMNFGCSFTFGEGLPQGMDYPSQLAEQLNDRWKVYNLSSAGWGPNNALYYVQNTPGYLDNITEKEGVFVWNYIPSHMDRFECSLGCYSPGNEYILRSPEYKKVGDSYEYVGPFSESKSPTRLLYSAISHLNIFKYMQFSHLKERSNSEIENFVRFLDYLSKSTGKNVTKKYIVVRDEYLNGRKWSRILPKYGFEMIPIGMIYRSVPLKNIHIPGDRHPTAEANWYLAKALKNRIEKDFPSDLE